jgi:hypothetical protein
MENNQMAVYQEESKAFHKLLVNNGYEPREYSGRGMFGKYCLGIVADDMSFIADIINDMIGQVTNNCYGLSEEEAKDIVQLLFSEMRTDSMGLSTIYYWPCMAWCEEFDLEDEEST